VAIDASRLGVTDAESGAAQLVYSVAAGPGHGFLALTSAPSVAVSTFTQEDIDNNRLVYVNDGAEAATDSFSFTVSDGAGGSLGATTFAISVNPINDAPATGLPGDQTMLAGTALVFSAANGNAIVVADADAGAAPVRVTLAASHGTLTLSGTAGLGFSVGNGTNASTMTFTGTIADVNAALDGLRFTPALSFVGVAGLSMSVDDLGNTGAGGAMTASRSIAVTVAVNAATPEPLDTPDVPLPPLLPVPPVVLPPVSMDPVVTPETPAQDAGGESPDETVTAGSPVAVDAEAAPAFAPSSGGQPPGTARAERESGGRGGNTAFGATDMRLLLASSDQPEISVTDFGFSQGSVNFQAAQSAMQSPALLDGMDRMREGLQDENRVEYNTVALTTAASLGLSVGYVLWLLRGGVLVGSMLSSMPAWRFVDPLPILGRLREEDDMEEPDETLESMVERSNRQRAAEAAAT
jgi:hypothetical protein